MLLLWHNLEKIWEAHMKNNKIIILLSCIIMLLLLVVTILLILLFGKNENRIYDNIAGIYDNNTWDGKGATLVINQDSSCEFPGGIKYCTWKIDNKTMIITLKYYIIITGNDYGGVRANCDGISSNECIEKIFTYDATVGNGTIVLNGHSFAKAG